MTYEHFTQPLASRKVWRRRVICASGIAGLIIGIALLVGIIGYHYMGELPWVDAILEASMILGGMGPVATMKSDSVKLFASVYALLSGFVLLSSFSVFTVPWLHRLLHRFHIQTPEA
jgi:sterol desaturase/sphingolipid hydroxylase (fatty acid hydroxylase superfamily)